MTEITKEIDKAVRVLNSGKIIAVPTETVYGLAANIYDDEALKLIFKTKQRPTNNPLIVHIKSIEQLEEVACEIPDIAIKLAAHYWPGPLTLVLKKQKNISNLISSGKDTVAVRVPNHKLALELLNNLEYPLAAPSANPFGSISPTDSKHVFQYFENKIDLILDGGKCSDGIESTIIGFDKEKIILYRHGSIAIEDLEKFAGKFEIFTKEDHAPVAPGMFSRHYAPKTKSYLVDDVKKELAFFEDKKIGVLLFKNKIETSKTITQYVLSSKGDYKEASKNLYAYLHEIDSLQLDVLLIERLPNIDLGTSINDRLSRAVVTDFII